MMVEPSVQVQRSIKHIAIATLIVGSSILPVTMAGEEIVSEVLLVTPAGTSERYTSIIYFDNDTLYVDLREFLSEAQILFTESASTIVIASGDESVAVDLSLDKRFDDIAYTPATTIEQSLGWSIEFDKLALALTVKTKAITARDREKILNRPDSRERSLTNLATVEGIAPTALIRSVWNQQNTSNKIQLKANIRETHLEYTAEDSSTGALSHQLRANRRTDVGRQLKFYGSLGDLSEQSNVLGYIRGRGIWAKLDNRLSSKSNQYFITIPADEEVTVYFDDKIVDIFESSDERVVNILLPRNIKRGTLRIEYKNTVTGELSKESRVLSTDSKQGSNTWAVEAALYDVGRSLFNEDTTDVHQHQRAQLTYALSTNFALTYDHHRLGLDSGDYHNNNYSFVLSNKRWHLRHFTSIDQANHRASLNSLSFNSTDWNLQLSHQSFDAQFFAITPDNSSEYKKQSETTRFSATHSPIELLGTLIHPDYRWVKSEVEGAAETSQVIRANANIGRMGVQFSHEWTDAAQKTTKINLNTTHNEIGYYASAERVQGDQEFEKFSLGMSLPQQYSFGGRTSFRYAWDSAETTLKSISWIKSFERFRVDLSVNQVNDDSPTVSAALSSRLITDTKNNKIYATSDLYTDESRGDILFEYQLKETGKSSIDLSDINPDLTYQSMRNIGGKILLTGVPTQSQPLKFTYGANAAFDTSPIIQDNAGIQSVPSNLSHVQIEFAQTGELDGYVKVNQAGAVSGVKVEAVDSNGKITSTAVTASDGYYYFGDLPVGTYTLRINEEHREQLKLAIPTGAATAEIKLDHSATVDLNMSFSNEVN